MNSARSRFSQLVKFIKEYLIVGLSGLLDRQYYAATNPDVQQARSDPIAHYLSHGWQEGRDPSEAFDTLAYMEQNRDVHFAAINPLVHYVIWRVREGRRAGSDAHNSAASAAARPEPTPRIRRPLIWVLSRTYAPWPRAGGRYPVVPPGSFSFPSSEVMRRHEAALTNWNGVRTKLVARDGKLWAIKRSGTSADNRRERLVYALSRGLVNAAEVVPLSPEEILRLFAMNLVENNAFPGNTFLVRLAQDYSKDELPLQDIDSATAGELVFSLWVRRRDVTDWNRAYTVDGVPVFFDYHASLDSQPWLADCKTFFSHDGGEPGRWRVVVHTSAPLLTPISRRGSTLAIHDLARFRGAVQDLVSRIQSTEFHLEEKLRTSGFSSNEADLLTRFLERTRADLSNDVAVMLEVVFSPGGRTS